MSKSLHPIYEGEHKVDTVDFPAKVNGPTF